MAVALRLQRLGRKNRCSYRVVAADRNRARDGKNIEVLGWYDPHRKGETEKINFERVDYWLSVGAEASPTVKQIIKRSKKAQA